MGWSTGFEPATARSTIWGSNQAELRPPTKGENLIVFAEGVKLLLPHFRLLRRALLVIHPVLVCAAMRIQTLRPTLVLPIL